MDKENLYYLVRKGMNDRIPNALKDEPLICTKDAGELELKNWEHHELISIQEYEDTYKDTESS